MTGGRYRYREVLPLAAMLTAECANVGLNTLYKAAATKGLSFHVFMVYSYAVSALILLPLAYLFHRKTPLPLFTILLLGKFFVIGSLGFAGQFLGNLGITYSSPTMSSAMSNLAPATTFFLAILFRMEKLKIGSTSSQAKTIGALVSITGALVVVLYNGPVLISGHDDHQLRQSYYISNNYVSGSFRSNWIIGGALLAACYVIASLCKFVREYPAEVIFVFFYNFFAFTLALPVCIVSEPHLSSWKLPADIRLLSVLYRGIIGSGLTITIHTWGLHVKGPIYVALFRRLSIAIAAIFGVLFLGDDLYLGSMIGSIVITVGFFTVMWGIWKEETIDDNNVEELPATDLFAPLVNN